MILNKIDTNTVTNTVGVQSHARSQKRKWQEKRNGLFRRRSFKARRRLNPNVRRASTISAEKISMPSQQPDTAPNRTKLLLHSYKESCFPVAISANVMQKPILQSLLAPPEQNHRKPPLPFNGYSATDFGRFEEAIHYENVEEDAYSYESYSLMGSANETDESHETYAPSSRSVSLSRSVSPCRDDLSLGDFKVEQQRLLQNFSGLNPESPAFVPTILEDDCDSLFLEDSPLPLQDPLQDPPPELVETDDECLCGVPLSFGEKVKILLEDCKLTGTVTFDSNVPNGYVPVQIEDEVIYVEPANIQKIVHNLSVDQLVYIHGLPKFPEVDGRYGQITREVGDFHYEICAFNPTTNTFFTGTTHLLHLQPIWGDNEEVEVWFSKDLFPFRYRPEKCERFVWKNAAVIQEQENILSQIRSAA